MTYFDATLDFAPVTEQNSEPVLPEERFVFELVGLERSEPDQWRKEGGIRWTWRVFMEDGRTPFVFQDEQYLLFRTTGIDRQARPVMSEGTYAYEWASAMLGHQLAIDETLNPAQLRGARMSAMVVWKPQKNDPKKKSVTLASLRHVPTGQPVAAPAPSRVQVEATATVDDVDRALALSKFEKKLERARKRKLPTLATFEDAWDAITGATSKAEIDALIENLDTAIDAMDD